VVAFRRGARRAFEELGIERELPTAREWMALVGQPLASGFERLFPDLRPEQRERVMASCVEETSEACEATRSFPASSLPELHSDSPCPNSLPRPTSRS
jgi:hypothetical protein